MAQTPFLTGMDLRDQRDRPVHGRPRQPRRHHRAARDPPGPRRLAPAARVDGQRLHADVRGPAAHRRRARRPLRPSPDVRHRPHRVHRRLARGGPRAEQRGPDPRPGRPGHRWRDRHAAQPDDPVRGGSAGATGPRARRVGRDRRARDRDRPARGWRHRPGPQLALDLPAQRPGRHRRDHLCLPAARRDLRTRGRPRHPGPRPRQRGPAGHRVGRDQRQRPRLDRSRDPRGHRRRRACSWSASWPGRLARRTRCCRWTCSAAGPSRPPTRRRC